MKKQLFYFILLGLFLFYKPSFSQELKNENSIEKNHKIVAHKNEHFKKHAISFVISHTYLKTGIKDDSGDSFLTLPSFAINYNYNFNEKWALGWHNDIIIEEFVVSDSGSHESENVFKSETNEDKTIDRGRPVSSAIMLTYKPLKHLAFLGGGGMEFSKHKDFAVVRLGLEAPFHIPNNWEIFGSVLFDININAYNSLSFGLGIAKLF
ncbi:MAG: hypothetical protein L3J34_03400 [Flavobacteriaceae bacterium]|nr:hypothetical protein [Flavobacteriaceae bacterium]